jgi:hypothetical protein
MPGSDCRSGERGSGAAIPVAMGSGAPSLSADCCRRAHLSGQPLNDYLVALGARLRCTTRTAPEYRLYALPDGKRPGLLHVFDNGAEIEMWDVPSAALGCFLASIAPPLGPGSLFWRAVPA